MADKVIQLMSEDGLNNLYPIGAYTEWKYLGASTTGSSNALNLPNGWKEIFIFIGINEQTRWSTTGHVISDILPVNNDYLDFNFVPDSANPKRVSFKISKTSIYLTNCYDPSVTDPVGYFTVYYR